LFKVNIVAHLQSFYILQQVAC